jgi:DNA mismatch repair ATPase MutS
MDEIYKRINTTSSSVGEEFLYDMLRTPVTDTKELTERIRVIDFFQKNVLIREKMQAIFAACGRVKRIALSDYIGHFSELKEISVSLDVLQALALLCAIIGMFLKPGLFIYYLIVMVVLNIFTYYRKKSKIESYFVCIRYMMQLASVANKLFKLSVKDLSSYLKSSNETAKKLLKKKNVMFWLGDNATLTDSLSALILDYIRMLFHVDLIAFRFLQKHIKQNEDGIEQLIENLGFLESCLCIASFRESLPSYCIPHYEEEVSIVSHGLYHPMLTSPVANDMETTKSVLLTGSNASGKSTFLKTVAMNAILAQTIGTVCAKDYVSCPFQIYSSMSLRDHLDQAESYYITEVKALKRILEHKEDSIPYLCFVDEVLRGTNTIERIASSTSILQSLAEGNGLCFAATHDIELTYLLEGICENYYFQEDICNGDIIFDYQLHKGRAKSRNAIQLLEILGYDKTITTKASQMATRFLESGDWSLS